MSIGTDYQRYKHKLERLQSKVKRSEHARKELEIRLQRLMKERSECEKSASIHKSKYHTLLKHERNRLSRNGELLQMLEDVQAKASALASNTERLKMLKNQQERILINNWRRNACLQQQIFYPNILYPNTVQYVMPPQPLAPSSSLATLSSQLPPPPPPPTAVISHDYQNSAINCIPGVDSDGKPIAIYGTPSTCFIDNSDAIFRKSVEAPTIQSFVKPTNVATQQQPSFSQQLRLSSSLMPIYQSEPIHSLYNNFHIRSHEPQQYVMKTNNKINTSGPTSTHSNTILAHKMPNDMNQSTFQETSFIPNRINKAMTNIHMDGCDQSIHKNANPIQFHETYAERVEHRPRDNFIFPQHLNKAHQYGQQLYSPIESINRKLHSTNMEPINQFSFDDESTSSQINVPLSHQINKTMPTNLISHSENKSNSEPSMCDDDSVTDMFANKMNESEINANASEIDSMSEYDRSINARCNEPFEEAKNIDVYANGNRFKSIRNESIDMQKAISSSTNATTTTIASISNTSSSPKYATDFTTHENAQHIPYSASALHIPSTTIDDALNERVHHPYESSTSEKTYASVHPNESNNDITDPIHIDFGKTVAAANISSHTLLSSESQEKSTTKFNGKRRSSIDADSFAKTLGHDTHEKELIAANIRRRYSVAANFLNLPNNTAQPAIAANEYQVDGKDWLNNTSTMLANTIEPTIAQIDSIRTQENDTPYNDDGLNNQRPFETISMPRIDDNSRNGSTVAVRNQDDVALTDSAAVARLPIGSNENYPSNTSPNQGDQSVKQYDTKSYETYTMDDQTYVENAMDQLKLDDNDSEHRPHEETRHIQFDDSADRIRASGKTVTWADDPESNYKKQDTANMYEVQNVNQSDSQPIQQHDYAITDGNGSAADASNESPHYQYDSNQYDNAQYQYAETPDTVTNQNVYTNDDYYYGTEQINQYDQYAAQPQVEAQPQQQEGTQQLQYYATDTTEINEGSSSANDDYQNVRTESTLQMQPKPDEYYTVSPGENYYTDYENVDENRTAYATSSNARNSQAVNVAVVEQQQRQQQHQQQPQQQQQQQQQHQESVYVPNYLQSDTDDSQTGYQNQTVNNAPQNQDSDFDFSTNS